MGVGGSAPTRVAHHEERAIGEIHAASCCCRGRRGTMEDAHVLGADCGGMLLFAVFDGHGGSVVAEEACVPCFFLSPLPLHSIA
jgi:hypothetical protein